MHQSTPYWRGQAGPLALPASAGIGCWQQQA